MRGKHTNSSIYYMTTMKVKAVIEKGSDGLFAVYSDSHIHNHFFGGFGDNVSEAKEDFEESIREAIEATKSNAKLKDIAIEYKYDIPSLFNFLDYINVSRFADYAGINESKMRAYKSGKVFPGERTMKKITAALVNISNELKSVSLIY